MIIHGDCLEEMRKMEDNSISCIVTDPPYGLSFMGKEWDHEVPGKEYWIECLRVAKPGSFLLAMGGTRTFHRLTCAIEDAGFEIRDCLSWLYGSGFPKSHNHFGLEGYGTALKPAHEPIIFASKPYEISHLLAIILLDLTNEVYSCQKSNYNVSDAELNLSDSLVLLDRVQGFIVQDNAKMYAWDKLSDVRYVAKNVMCLSQELNEKTNREKEFFAHINAKDLGNEAGLMAKKILHGEAESLFVAIQDIVIFALKENTEQNIVWLWKNILAGIYQGMSKFTTKTVINLITELRILKSCLSPSISRDIGSFSPDYEPIIMAMKPCDGTFAQNAAKWGQAGINIEGCRIETIPRTTHTDGNYKGGGNDLYESGLKTGYYSIRAKGRWPANILFDEEAAAMLDEQSGIEASRFFYCAKTSSRERNEGCVDLPEVECQTGCGGAMPIDDDGKERDRFKKISKNHHPTVKPLKLMEYLITLVMPPKDGILLDPFAGSGTTILAAHRLGIKAIGIEKSAEYCEIARKRLKNVTIQKTPLQLNFLNSNMQSNQQAM